MINRKKENHLSNREYVDVRNSWCAFKSNMADFTLAIKFLNTQIEYSIISDCKAISFRITRYFNGRQTVVFPP